MAEPGFKFRTHLGQILVFLIREMVTIIPTLRFNIKVMIIGPGAQLSSRPLAPTTGRPSPCAWEPTRGGTCGVPGADLVLLQHHQAGVHGRGCRLGVGVARGQAQVLAGCNALEDATELWELMA